jgi:hypothetical protein
MKSAARIRNELRIGVICPLIPLCVIEGQATENGHPVERLRRTGCTGRWRGTFQVQVLLGKAGTHRRRRVVRRQARGQIQASTLAHHEMSHAEAMSLIGCPFDNMEMRDHIIIGQPGRNVH